MRRFVVWLDKQLAGVDAVRELVIDDVLPPEVKRAEVMTLLELPNG